MSRAPVRRPAAAPIEPTTCPRNDECQREMARAASRIADAMEAGLAEYDAMKPQLKAVGAVFERWEKMCVWVRAKTPKHGWWLLIVLWGFTNLGSPELKAALNEWMAVLIRQAMAGGGG